MVIGGGAGGHACVTTYREAGGDDPVVLVSADDRPPYFRPLVSKEYLAGEAGVDELALSPAAWYAAHDVELRLDCEVVGLDLANRTVATTDGPLRWSQCVLAMGSDPAPLPVPGTDDPDVVTIRAAVDAERLVDALRGPVVVVGSGFIGCEAAASLARRGVPVTIVSHEARPQQDRLGEAVGRLVDGWLRDSGIEVIGGHQVGAVERHGDELVLDVPGRPAVVGAHVVVAVGARPRLGLVAAAGLVSGDDGGVPVDGSMRTAAPGVLAVGDIVDAWHATAGRRLRVEHWGDAVTHGKVAATTLVGGRSEWREPPGFWSTIAGRTIKHVAWGDGHDAVEVRRSSSGTTVWYGREGVVVGALTHDHDEDNEVAATALTERWSFPPGG